MHAVGKMYQSATAAFTVACRHVDNIDSEAFLAEPEIGISHVPAGKPAEQPAIVRVPIVLRRLRRFFHQLFQQHGPSRLGSVVTLLKRRGNSLFVLDYSRMV